MPFDADTVFSMVDNSRKGTSRLTLSTRLSYLIY